MYDPDLESTFDILKKRDRRRAAEVAYVLAVLAKRREDFAEAKSFANESIKIFESLKTESLEDCVARFHILNEVCLPDYIHEDVVKDRLSDLLE